VGWVRYAVVDVEGQQIWFELVLVYDNAMK